MTKEEILRDVKLFALDMDGTVYLGNQLIEGALDFIRKLEEQGRDFVFFTNNSSRVPSDYREKLKKMGYETDTRRILSSSDVSVEYLKTKHAGKKIYLMGTPILEDYFRNNGIDLVEEEPDMVVAAFDTSLTYDKLYKICTFINRGAVFLATHPDLLCPTEDSTIMPDCGVMCALITKATGVQPKYLGKPHSETMDMVASITGHKRSDIAFVGDRIYTDVATGVNNGGKGFLVLTGETTTKDVEASEMVPDGVFDSLKEMAGYL